MARECERRDCVLVRARPLLDESAVIVSGSFSALLNVNCLPSNILLILLGTVWTPVEESHGQLVL